MSVVAPPAPRALTRLNRPRRLSDRRMLQIFMVIVLAHWVEHLAQACQIYVLGWEPPAARGALGLQWPWLVSSEAMHYGYALIMLAGLIYLRGLFGGRARRWWTAALTIQVWHHLEHLLLLGQALFAHPLFGEPKATSIIQLVIPRVELHLFYNAVVFTPMVIAIYLWSRDRRGSRGANVAAAGQGAR